MSKPHVSPYRRNAYNNSRNGVSPYRDEPLKLAEKSKLSHSLIADQNMDKRVTPNKEEGTRATEKKRGYQYSGTVNHNRLDTLVEQNKFLLAENNELANLLNDRSRVIIALEQKLEQQIAQEVMTLQEIEIEKNRFLEEYADKMRQNGVRNECLMDEIAQLNEDIYQLEVSKSRQIETVKENYSREHKAQLEKIFSNHTQTTEIMQIEINKLKEIIMSKDNQIECLSYEGKSATERMKNKCQELEKNLNHVIHMKKIEASQQKIHYQKIIEDVKRDCQKLNQISISQHEAEIKKVKKELLTRQFEVEKLGNDMSENHIDAQIRINELCQKKGELENQIAELQNYHRNLTFQETQKIKKLAQAEQETSENMNSHVHQNLRKQIGKLQDLNETRSAEIARLYAQIDELRSKHDDECQDLRLQVENLKQLLNNQREDIDEQNEGLKTKLAELRHADISSLQKYYQNELAAMTVDLNEKDQIVKDNREKVHRQIQEKTQMRKNFQIETSKLRMRIGQLELRIAGIVQEKKQELAAFGSQMQLTSMSLLRTAEEKQKYSVFSQSEKQKLQTMISNKDNEIEQLNDKIKMMVQNHNDEITNKNEEISILCKTIQELETNLKKEKFFLESEIKKKQTIRNNDKEFYESQMAKIKKQANDEYNKMLALANKEKAIIEQQRLKLRKAQKELNGELNQVKEFREQENIDRQIAMSEQEGRATSQKQILEETLKSYYAKQMQVKDSEIKDLKQQILQLNTDIRSHIQKEQKLEDKMQRLLESQEKLRDMEHRVMALGQENNLVKNLSEIVKNRRK